MVELWVPEESSGEIAAVDQLESPVIAAAVASWRRAKGAGHFPADPKPFIGNPNAFVVRILGQGTDYQYDHVGSELVKGFNEDFTGRTVSSLVETNPKFGLGLRMLYDMVRFSGETLGYRGWVGRDLKGALFNYHENAILPFGAERVEHIVVITALVLRQHVLRREEPAGASRP